MSKQIEDTQCRKRVAIYARVSTEEQALSGYSIDAQLNTLKNYCSLYNKEVVAEYVDRGISGKSIKGRLQLQKLIEDARAQKFDEVLVWKISRLSRKTIDLLKIVEELSKNNVVFKSFSENFETETAMGRFALQMMGAVGELERNTIIDNVKLGMAQRSREGKWNGGICLGYSSEIVDESKTGEKNLVIVESEAELVRKIFNLYASGKGLRAIANTINKQGYRTKKDNTFSTAAISEIISNPVYVGKVRFNRYENWSEKKRKGKSENVIIADGTHEAIISQDLWDKVQAIKKTRAEKPMKNFEGNYVLTGLIKCPVCGATMVGTRTTNKLKDGSKKVLRYYSCGAARSKGASVCKFNSIRADYAEQAVLDRIQEIVQNPKILEKIVKKVNDDRVKQIKPYQAELKEIEKAISEIEKNKGKYVSLYEKEMIEVELFSERITELSKKIESLSNRRIEIENTLEFNSSVTLEIEEVRSVIKNLASMLGMMDNQEKKTFYHMIISRISVEDKKIKDIHLKIPDTLNCKSQIKPPSNKTDGGFLVRKNILKLVI